MPPVIQPAAVTASWTLERENILIDAILHELSENGRPNDGSNFKAVAYFYGFSGLFSRFVE